MVSQRQIRLHFRRKNQGTHLCQAWEKISNDVVIHSFDVCSIATDNAEKISCRRSELTDTFAEESNANINDINNDDEIDVL